ncbi:Bardet-Biedl syndrome 1 [Arctopsyche grandis]|uniref:Bardet-Biedl syndrome 1 n=1 Tax=Arctopsyche grandis TaxID=121162 RepID=UPI00406D6478
MNALSDLNPVSRWLDVLGSTEHNICTLPMNVAFADLNCDLDFKLVVADMGLTNNVSKLKVFKGTSIINEIILPDIPTSIISFFTNETLPRNPPVIAVSMCSSVYIYKNMKLFYKFYLPPLEILALELEVWRQLSDIHIKDDEALIKVVEKLSDVPFSALTAQSQHLLSLPPEKYINFVKQHFDFPMQKTSVITCMTTLNMNSIDKDGVACLILGTENGDINILDPQTFTILHQARVHNTKATPTIIQSSGLFDVEFRIIIATREGSICILRREWLEGKCLVQLSSLVVGLIITPGDNSIVVASMDKTLQCFSKKGKRNWSLNLPHTVTTITLVQLGHLGVNLIAVAMTGGLIQFYNGKNLVDLFQIQDTVSVMKFGQLGQEENVLVLITSDGGLRLKILKRTAEFNVNSINDLQKTHPSLSAAQQARPLLVPKKSKLFLEQAAREREQFIPMHETFQRELCQLRLYVAKATVESMQNANNSLNIGSSEPLKLSAKIEGLGPTFNIHLFIENLSVDKAVAKLSLLFVTDCHNYKVSTPYIQIPMLVPGRPYTFATQIKEIFTTTQTETAEDCEANNDNQEERPSLKVILIKEGHVQPLLAATIHIPPTDPLMMPFDKIESSVFFP